MAKPENQNKQLHRKQQFLVLRAQVGDEKAFKQLYDLFSHRTLRFLSSLTNPVEAQDLNQELWLGVYHRIATLADPQGFNTWLFRSAKNRALDHFRRTKRLDDFQEAFKTESIESGPTGDMMEEFLDPGSLEKLLQKLSIRHREVIVLHFLEGMDYEEIALITGCALGTIKSRAHNAKLKLKQLTKNR